MGVSLLLEKRFSRSSFYGIASILTVASGPHLDATITSENIFQRSSVDGITLNCGPLMWRLLLFSSTFSVGPVFMTRPVFQSLLVDHV